ncbi:diphosphate--fructose-6-phosphate 1-phosphotransferase [Niabella terrae]
MQQSILILAAGGPAPGINTVISSVSKIFLRSGFRVIGLHDGYKNLFTGNASTVDIDFELADNALTRGGSFLRMSRYKPKNEEFKTDFFVDNNVKLLVTIGGDDTASTANRISTFLTDNKFPVQNIHVPKTIDNDLPLPDNAPTFGYQSATEEGVRITKTVYEDARTSANWFVLSAMGREAGHLAFSIGASCQLPMIVIPEMFNKAKLDLGAITKLIVSAILKRKILGINYGAAVVSEGVFHFMSDEDIKNSGVQFTYDAHGHPELGNVSKAHIYNVLLQDKLKELGLDVKCRPVELGYELRCLPPAAFDLQYCTLLGTGVKTLFDKGLTGCVVTVNNAGEIAPLFLKDVTGENGKVKTRLVNIDDPKTRLVFDSVMQYLTADDVEAARKFVPHPEEFVFSTILGWN